MSKTIFSGMTSMAKPVRSLMLLAMTLTASSAWAISGSGTSTDHYKVATAADWANAEFTAKVNASTSSNPVYIDITGNFTTTTMIGDSEGTAVYLDGQGHKITLDINTDLNKSGLVRHLAGGKIENLHISGNIKSSSQSVGSVVGRIMGSATLSNVFSDVKITSTKSGDNSSGGLVGVIANTSITLTVSNCAFTGSFVGNESSTCISGLVGYRGSKATANFNNCYCSATWTKCENTGLYALVRGDGTNTAYKNTYYVNAPTKVTDKPSTNSYLPKQTTAAEIANGTLLGNLNTSTNNYCQPENYSYPVPHTFGNGICSTCKVNQTAKQSGSYYIISNAGNLAWFANKVNNDYSNYKTAKAKLENDIDLSSLSGNWTPIGISETYPFMGEFDGQCHSITNMKIENFTAGYQALFGCVDKATIKNFTLSGKISTKTEGLGKIAGVVARCKENTSSTSTIEGVTNNVNITVPSGSHIGGICGSCSPATINRCINNGKIDAGSSSDCIGGIVGYAQRSTKITDCVNTAVVKSTNNAAYIGGILGYINDTKFDGVHYCLNTDSVKGGTANTYAGAIFGRFRSTAENTSSGNNMYLAGTATKAVGADEKNIGLKGKCTSVTNVELASGKVAYLLNREKASGVWSQNFEKETTPVPTNAGFKLTRSIKANWNTICVPFEAKSTDDVKFYVIKSLTGGEITLQLAETLEAGKPALVYTTSNTELSVVNAGTTFVTDVANATGTNRLVGTFSDITVPVDNDHYFFGLSANKGTYVQVKNTGVALGAFRAYIECNKEGNPAAGLRQVIADEEINETAIADVVETLNDSEAQYFDINGRKIAELKKGINIISINGKKVKVLMK